MISVTIISMPSATVRASAARMSSSLCTTERLHAGEVARERVRVHRLQRARIGDALERDRDVVLRCGR